MTKIQKIDNSQNRPILTPKNTGYAAAGALLIASARIFTNKKEITKSHKLIGIIASFLTLLHIGLVEYLNSKYKNL